MWLELWVDKTDVCVGGGGGDPHVGLELHVVGVQRDERQRQQDGEHQRQLRLRLVPFGGCAVRAVVRSGSAAAHFTGVEEWVQRGGGADR